MKREDQRAPGFSRIERETVCVCARARAADSLRGRTGRSEITGY